MRLLLKSWIPVVLWALLISLFSTDEFSSSNTSRILSPLVLWIFPGASPQLLETVHHVVRKLGHWSEYFVLSFLLLRAFQGGSGRELRRRWIGWTVALVLVYALVDELHQAYVPSRTASLVDSMINFFGGICGISWKHLRQSKNEESLAKHDPVS